MLSSNFAINSFFKPVFLVLKQKEGLRGNKYPFFRENDQFYRKEPLIWSLNWVGNMCNVNHYDHLVK